MIELHAPAKINLNLHILGRRKNGYHEVVTRMQKVDLCDRLIIEASVQSGVIFSSDDPTLPVGDDNLVVKAARLFFQTTRFRDRGGARIRLKKCIPVAAGLGGGSSDAGTVLRGLNTLYHHPLSNSQLIDVGRQLGADVPFFTTSSTAAIATGVGDKLSDVSALNGYWFLLVNPGIHVSTRWAFENYALTTMVKNSTLPGFQSASGDDFSPENMHNDLEHVTAARYPVVTNIKQSLLGSGAIAAMMSGSGPTVFGLFADGSGTGIIKNELVERFSSEYGGRVHAVHTYGGA